MDEIEAVLEAYATGKHDTRSILGVAVRVHVQRQIESNGLSRDGDLVDQIVRKGDQGSSSSHRVTDRCRRRDPTGTTTVFKGVQAAWHARLRTTASQRRVVRQRASIPMERALDVGPRPVIVEPTRRSVHQ